MNQIAVIGFGCAGYHGVRALRESGYGGVIDVYSDQTGAPANPMLTTYYTAGKIPYEAIFPFGTLEDIIREFNIRFFGGTRVEQLSAGSKTLTLAGGEKRRYDGILIATGAFPVVPALAGEVRDRVFCMRTPRDAEVLKEKLAEGRVGSAVVVGASMAGVKVAELLNNQGVACTLADAAERIFPLAAAAPVAAEIERRVRDRGVDLLFGQPLTGLFSEGSQVRAELCGKNVTADIVIFCIGTRPDIGFVNREEIDVRRGIVVDEAMRTTAEGIYAAGDCCEGLNLQTGEKQNIGLWANAAYQGRTAGRNLAGKSAEYDGTILHNITHFMGMDFIGFGDVNAVGETVHFEKPDGSFILHMVLDRGKALCVNILDNYVISGVVKHHILKRFLGVRESAAPAQRALLLKYGIPADILDRLEAVR